MCSFEILRQTAIIRGRKIWMCGCHQEVIVNIRRDRKCEMLGCIEEEEIKITVEWVRRDLS